MNPCPYCQKELSFSEKIFSPQTCRNCFSENKYRSAKGEVPQENHSESIDPTEPLKGPIKTMELNDFTEYYFKKLKSNLASFSKFFSIIGFILFIQTFIAIGSSVLISNDFQMIPFLSSLLLILNLILIIWFASLMGNFVELQTEKTEHDLVNKLNFQTETIKMGQDILQEAHKKTKNKIVVKGGNAVFAFDNSSIKGVTQTITINGNSELVSSLALLVSYCEQKSNEGAVATAKALATEATKSQPDKGVLIDLWTSIVSSVPEVSGIVEIAKDIKGLFS